MTTFRWIALLGLVAAGACRAAELLEWLPFEALSSGDAIYAQSTLNDEFGDDPALWPDWIDPRATLVPTARGDNNFLVIRRPLRLACGEYGFSVFSPITRQGGRAKLGEDFCAGDVQFVPVWGEAMPDLLFREGQGPDRRVRWTGKAWGEIKP